MILLTAASLWMSILFVWAVVSSWLSDNEVDKVGLRGRALVLVTAHPDDEAMFFSPTLLELGKSQYDNEIHLICLSNGDYDGLGTIRKSEVIRSGQMLGLDSVFVGDLHDDIKKWWEAKEIMQLVDKRIKELHTNKKITLLTFDESGVSDHPNHKSIYSAVKEYVKRRKYEAWKLKSWSLGEKYSGTVLSTWAIINNSKLLPANIGKDKSKTSDPDKVIIHSNINQWFVSMACMTFAHLSQMEWFRWGWLLLSRYMTCNELVRITASG